MDRKNVLGWPTGWERFTVIERDRGAYTGMAVDDERWMKRALREAARGLGLTSPNPAVGALLVVDGEVIGKGWHRGVGLPHAEVEALRDAADRGNGSRVGASTLYVTLEPCSSTGRTGPCTVAIAESGIRRVVVGCSDPDRRHQGRGIEWLESQGIEVRTEVLGDECREMIKGFRMRVTQGRPYIIAKVGVTLDGKTVLPESEGRWITGEESRDEVHRLRSEMDGIVVGGETVRQDDPLLNVRGRWAKRRVKGPRKIVVSGSGEIPEGASLFREDGSGEPLVFRGMSLREVMGELGDLGLNTVMVESGGRLMSSLFREELVDEVMVYYAPGWGGGPRQFLEVPERFERWPASEWKRLGADMRFRGWKGSRRKAVFFDRDGVVNRSPGAGYVLSWEAFEFNPGIAEGIRVAKARGYQVGLLTSQRCVEKGEISAEALEEMHRRMQEALRREGAAFDGVFAYTGEGCGFPNKPSPGMFHHGAACLDVDVAQCWMIGDADRDIVMAREAGAKGAIRIRSEHPVGVAADWQLEDTRELAGLLRSLL